MKNRKIKFAASCGVLLLSILVPAQTGGIFVIEKSVIAGGGIDSGNLGSISNNHIGMSET